ncbi:hypothetical protein [Bradyrhizobium sp. 27S5]|uniref:hypothetical protein n=1 Tax=Bradyrhizobium sp. 27S5 TaxID=3139728 RepID=UPI0030CF29BD
MADAVVKEEYALLKLPIFAGNVAASRKKRLYASAIEEYVEMKSHELQMGEWLIDPSTGDFINSKGQDVSQDLELTINDPDHPRSHWEIPEAPVEEAELIAAIWTKPNMTARAARFKQLRDYHKSDKLATAAFVEEAERHGVTKPFSDQVGMNPADVGDKTKAAARDAINNPWSASFRGDETARAARIASVIKTGTALANALVKAAGTTVSKPLRK